jgi:hypothetical protein
VIRTELFSRLTLTTKSKLLDFVRFLKEARMELGAAVEQLQRRPTSGELFVSVQKNLLNLYRGLLNLREFVRMVTQMLPACPIATAMSQFESSLRDILRPLRPSEPAERLTHVFMIQKMLFSVAIVLTLAERLKADDHLRGNAALFQSVSESMASLGGAYMSMQQVRRRLTQRPFSIFFLENAREQLDLLHRALVNARGTSDLAGTITGEVHFSTAVSFARDYVMRVIAAIEACKVDPYRKLPTSLTIKGLHDSLTNTLVTIMSAGARFTTQHEREICQRVQKSGRS